MSQAELALQLMQIMFRFNRSRRPPVSVPGLTPKEIYVLKIISSEDPLEPEIKVSDLSAKLNVSNPMVTQAVNSLEGAGLVERISDPHDRRVVRIKVTEKGEEVISKVSEQILADIQGLVSYLGETDARELVRLLNKASDYMTHPQEQTGRCPC